MATNCTFDGGSPFRIKRPLITTSGFVSDVDSTIKSHLDELNQLLGTRIFSVHGAPPPKRGPAAIAKAAPRMVPDVKDLLESPLTPKHTPPGAGGDWAKDSLASEFKHANEAADKITLSEYIDMNAQLSALKYSVDSNLSANFFNLDYNTRAVLDTYPAIKDYLIAYGFLVMGLHEANGLKNFILSNRLGAKNVGNYAIVSAARTIIDKEQLKVPHYNEDDSEIVAAIKAANLTMSAASFQTTLQARIDDFIFNSKESKIVDDAEKVIGPFPGGIKPLLIKYIKSSPVKITAANAHFFIPQFLGQIQGTTEIEEPDEIDAEEADKDFEVVFLEDDDSLVQISRSAVKCASQLYYSMVLGDELEVFNTVNYFTHKYLVRGGIEIQDARLRDDLQLYVFSNKFTDLKTKKVEDRTRPGERHMFYRQVFSQGNGQITEDVIVNNDFPRLWKVLILESAKYLERAQAAFNPDSYVSRQNVMQAVEDLQYNLSTSCTGMANVITPLIYAELDFVVRRIFMNKEILQQVVPQGGTWWRVVETLYMGLKHTRPRATVIYNKAKLGHDIIRSIADYNPTTFEDDRNFSSFISTVDAFITTQSILQEALTDDLKQSDDDEAPSSNGYHASGNGNGNGYHKPEAEAMPMPAPSGAPAPAAGGDEWDF